MNSEQLEEYDTLQAIYPDIITKINDISFDITIESDSNEEFPCGVKLSIVLTPTYPQQPPKYSLFSLYKLDAAALLALTQIVKDIIDRDLGNPMMFDIIDGTREWLNSYKPASQAETIENPVKPKEKPKERSKGKSRYRRKGNDKDKPKPIARDINDITSISFSDYERKEYRKNRNKKKAPAKPKQKLGFKMLKIGAEIKEVNENQEIEEEKVVKKIQRTPKIITEKPIDKEALISKLKEVSELAEPNPKPIINILFIGHLDSGKSTICGNLLLMTGNIDQRTLEAYEQEAKEYGRDAWCSAYIMDQNPEERQRDLTIEVGKASIETSSKRISILDAPGHKAFIPNMIEGAIHSDYAAMVISARIQEFENDFDKSGQTREHSYIAKWLGINKLIILINKMDDPSVNWSQERFFQIQAAMSQFLIEKCQYEAENLCWIPTAGIIGNNIVEKINEEVNNWYQGPTLYQSLENLNIPERANNNALRIPILDRTKDQGITVFGRIESGQAVKGLKVMVMPIRAKGEIIDIIGPDENNLMYGNSGEVVKIKLKLSEEINVQRGFIICDIHDYSKSTDEIIGDVQLLDLLEDKPLISSGYRCLIHTHTALEECEIDDVIAKIDEKRKKKQRIPYAYSNQRVIMRIRVDDEIAVELSSKNNQMGKFILRDRGKTIGLGKVVDVEDTENEEGDR